MEYEKAKKIVAKLLSFKMYTCKEVHQRLMQKGISEEVSERVIGDFVKAGILNDEEYAKLYIHDAVKINMKGIFRIKQELAQKGIASGIIERAISESNVDQNVQLEEYISLRFGEKTFTDWKELEKAKAHLVRRGFGIYDINKCFEKLGIKVVRGDLD